MGCSSAVMGAASEAIRIILELDKFENCLDRLESSKAFLGTAGTLSTAFGLSQIALNALSGLSAANYDLPTKGLYEEHLSQYIQLLRKYGDIIDRDISTIKASARRIMTADNAG